MILMNFFMKNIEIRGGSRTAATSKMEHFVKIVDGFQLHKELHLACCSSPRSASDFDIFHKEVRWFLFSV